MAKRRGCKYGRLRTGKCRSKPKKGKRARRKSGVSLSTCTKKGKGGRKVLKKGYRWRKGGGGCVRARA